MNIKVENLRSVREAAINLAKTRSVAGRRPERVELPFDWNDGEGLVTAIASDGELRAVIVDGRSTLDPRENL